MDTTEELNGTYFYHGQSNLPAGELFDVIFLEQFCDEPGIGIESGAAILAGQPWLKTRTKPGEAISYLQVWENAFTKCTNSFWY
ncbi:membrane protein [Salmonella enterica subsp. enterica]|nr:membrane protein [Salmonella enterica subsp. enterica]